MPGVTITANYGAGGSYIAPAVARALSVPMLDRAISTEVAAALHVSVQEAEGGQLKRSLVDRFLGVLAPLSGGVLGAGTDAAPPENAFPAPEDSDLFREQAEVIMRSALASGAVIHGRAGAAAFQREPGVLHVYLGGATQARIVQGAAIEHVSLEQARKARAEVDRARAHYVRRLYNISIDDPSLYDLQLDSTRLPLDTCVELITLAYRSLRPDRARSDRGAE
ncbi:cytidylate kinase-like family protein [Jatrophihabitans telluris]|uniref:Cytidylate kinase-like family protein n=1 Tax=Jatrophihabitans telluris TaxID=2038343 RepID=A0ABY4QTD8_9ACTN|nr:cytidylate kinase-like family protein [Jatrophihabitans telluris]UQX86974.1 cytidylate kinase-like family protein [Jatrophihabitans telluris]